MNFSGKDLQICAKLVSVSSCDVRRKISVSGRAGSIKDFVWKTVFQQRKNFLSVVQNNLHVVQRFPSLLPRPAPARSNLRSAPTFEPQKSGEDGRNEDASAEIMMS